MKRFPADYSTWFFFGDQEHRNGALRTFARRMKKTGKILTAGPLPRLALEDSLLSLKLSSGRVGIESAHRSTKATSLATGARLVWKSCALPLPCHFASVTTSRLLWNRKHLVTGVAWRSITRRTCYARSAFVIFPRFIDGDPRSEVETRSPSLDNVIRISENWAEANTPILYRNLRTACNIFIYL